MGNALNETSRGKSYNFMFLFVTSAEQIGFQCIKEKGFEVYVAEIETRAEEEKERA